MATQLHDRPTVTSTHTPRLLASLAPVQRLRALQPRLNRAAAAPATTRPNVALAGLELLVGYEFLASGIDKLLYGSFPDSLGQLLSGQLSGGHIPALFSGLLSAVVVPNAIFFGWLIQLGEVLAGLGLLAAALGALLRPLVEAHAHGRPWQAFAGADRLAARLAPVAAAGAGLLALSFYLLDGLPGIGLAPSIAYGGAVDTGLFLAVACAVILVVRLSAERRARR